LPLPALIDEAASRIPRDATVIAILPPGSTESAMALGNLRRRGFAVTALLNMYEDWDFAIAAAPFLAEGIDTRHLKDEGLWQAVVLLSRVDSAIARSVELGEPAQVAKVAFQLGQGYSSFYDAYNVLLEENLERKTVLFWINGYFRRQLERVLGVLGIPVPEYM